MDIKVLLQKDQSHKTNMSKPNIESTGQHQQEIRVKCVLEHVHVYEICMDICSTYRNTEKSSCSKLSKSVKFIMVNRNK